MSSRASSRASILVIDDEPGLRDMLAYELSQEGFDVETADSGVRAIEAMSRRRFDVAITDLKMPGMDGVETLEALRIIDPDIEVIVATGYATVETAVACMKHGAYDYIQKPYDLEQLTLLLDRALEKSHLSGVVALYEASRALLATLHHGELTRLVADLTRKVLRAGAIGLVLDGEPVNLDVPAGGAKERASLELLLELVARAKTPVRLLGATGDLPPRAEQEGFASALVYPLVSHERVIGHLAVLRGASQPHFSEGELRRGAIFAGQLALSLDNARLYEELARKIEELVETREQLVQAEKLAAMAGLAAGVAHEINNPLTFVQVNLGALQDYSTTVGGLWLAAKAAAGYLRGTGAPEATRIGEELLTAGGHGGEATEQRIQEVAEMIDEILEGVQRIAGLVSGFERIAQPQEPTAPEEVDVAGLVHTCLAEWQGAGSGELPIAVDITGAPRALVALEDLHTALLNLFVFLHTRRSAARTQEDAPLLVRGATEGGKVVLSIADPTLVLSDDERLRALDPRFEVDARRGRTLRLDLGMPLAHQLLRRNGGNLTLTHAPRAGTLLLLEMPAVPPEPPHARRSDGERARQETGS